MSLYKANKTDEELVKIYRKSGDKTVVGELFKRHSLMCFAVCNKYLKNESAAQDGAMNVFEKLFEDLKKHDIQNFRSWLHTVCRNHCLMELRKPNKNMMSFETDGYDESGFMELEAFLHQDNTNEEKEHKLQTLEKAIVELKDKQRECIELFYIQQKSYEEICALTGYTNNDVKSNIQNGKRNLKIILGNKDFLVWLTLITWTGNFA